MTSSDRGQGHTDAGSQARVLFVDDEPNILQSLRRALRTRAGSWQLRFASSAAEALQLLEREPCDVIAADLQMPGMDGATLLATVQTRWPAMLRIITSGSCERQHVVAAVKVAHQFLAKPYTVCALEDVVDRALRLRDLLQEPSLTGLVSGLEHLPVLPENYAKLTAALRDTSQSLQDIGRLIQQDVALTAKILQIVNSAFFALPRRVATPTEAVLYLGIDVLQSVVLATELFGKEGRADIDRAHVQQLWAYSGSVAERTRVIGTVLGCSRSTKDSAFVAGLMHDLGALILMENRCSEYRASRAAIARGELATAVEQRMFGGTHAEIGGYLLGTWGLADDVVTSVAYHHRPRTAGEPALGALTLLHLADCVRVGRPDAEQPELDLDYLDRLGIRKLLPDLHAALSAHSAQAVAAAK
jgi:HD-like signal output (HDOD) protein